MLKWNLSMGSSQILGYSRECQGPNAVMVIERRHGVLDGLGFGTTQTGFKSSVSPLEK